MTEAEYMQVLRSKLAGPSTEKGATKALVRLNKASEFLNRGTSKKDVPCIIFNSTIEREIVMQLLEAADGDCSLTRQDLRWLFSHATRFAEIFDKIESFSERLFYAALEYSINSSDTDIVDVYQPHLEILTNPLYSFVRTIIAEDSGPTLLLLTTEYLVAKFQMDTDDCTRIVDEKRLINAFFDAADELCEVGVHSCFIWGTRRPTRCEFEFIASGINPRNGDGIARMQLHSTSGKALEFVDGSGEYMVHGRTVPEWLIANPERLTVDLIDREPNAEIRRVMMEKYGLDRFVKDGKAKLVHRDSCGKLYKRQIRGSTLSVVLVKNSTPEPDGTYKTYSIRVPPSTKTARGGIAWSFGLKPSQYRPLKQT